jgi:ZIP family zinc transporter
MSLVGGAGVSVSLLAGIWISNFPESLGSTVNMVTSGWTKAKIRLLWWAIVLVSAASAGIGFVVVDNSSMLSGVLIESFAAGALLTMIADEMAPEAYKRSMTYAGLATVAGFALAVWLTSLE